jgi:glycosyltransferase involved in cell wall biosynthesis
MKLETFISVVICTYGRATALRELLDSLDGQSYRNFETLIIDGNGENSPAHDTVERFRQQPGQHIQVHLIGSEKGLTRQRNVGLQRAGGDVICFLDDDVTLEANFLSRVSTILEEPEMQDVGGFTAYDVRNYPSEVSWRWRLRRVLGVIPKIDPGGVDHLGRAVPLSFLKPFGGYKEIGWLSGFCMIYRRAATSDLRFDELVPTYGGEDRDFSMRVGRNWRLLICGDLHVQHHCTAQGRESDLPRLFQSSFGTGRRFAQYARSARDYWTVAVTFFGDLLIDLLVFSMRPRQVNLLAIFVRMKGFIAGLRSETAAKRPAAPLPTINSMGQEPGRLTRLP